MQHSQAFLTIFCPKGMKLMVYQQQAKTWMTRNRKTSPFICVATAITIVRIIDSTYTIDGIILLFFVMSFRWPDGVERKQLPAMFSTCPKEYRIAKAVTLKLDSTNTKETMSERTKPVIEQASHPMIRVLYERSPQRVFSFPKLKSSLSLFFSPVPSSKAFPMIQISQ